MYIFIYIYIYIYICRYAIAVDSSRSDLIVAMSAIANSWVDRLLRCWSLLGSHGSWLQVRFPRKWSMNGGIVPCFPYTYIYIHTYMDIYIYIWIYVYIIYMWSCRRVIMVYQYKWPFTPTLWAIHLLMDDSNPSIGVSNSYLFQPLDRCDKPLDVARHMALLYTVCTICTIYI